MLKYLLHEHAVTGVPIFVLLFFCSLLLAILFWMYRPGASALYRKYAASPISDTE